MTGPSRNAEGRSAHAPGPSVEATIDEPGHDLLRHHGDVEAVGMLDLAVNVAVSTPPPFLVDAVTAAVADLAAYPDPSTAMRQLADHLGVPVDRVLLTNGAAEAFHLLARARAWQHAVVVHPQFTEPDTALRAAGITPDWHVLPAPGFGLDAGEVERLESAYPTADLVVLGNPTNPTSRLHAAADVLSVRRPGRVVVVDEAFMDVVPREQDTVLRHAAAGEGLVVVRSLTKTFGLAGLRAGFIVGEPDLLDACRRVQPHWSVNHLALTAVRAIATREGVEHTRAVTSRVQTDRAYLVAALEGLGFTVVEPAAGPFVLASHPQAARLRQALRGEGIAVRRADTFPGLDGSWIRVAVRDRATTDTLADALRRVGAQTITTEAGGS